MARRFPLLSLLTLTASIAPIAGCARDVEDGPRPLGPDQFIGPTDRGGAVVPGRPTPSVGPETNGDAGAAAPAGRGTAAPGRPRNDASQPGRSDLEFVRDQVTASPGTTQPATLEADGASTFAPGQFLPVGGIVAEVNGTPIYADAVFRAVAPMLAARAKGMDRAAFRSLASTEINRQTDEMIRAEVEYAAADRNTTAEEKAMAQRLTEQWRDKLITDNKGSIEEARRKIRESGRTFEEVSRDQYRLNLVRVYYTRKLFPRIQVTADDMRRFYDQNREKLFTDRDNATFRLIKISAKDMGGAEKARQKIEELAARIERGEDFSTIAGEINHDPMLLRNQGLMGPIDRGAYKLETVEEKIWQTEPGKVTPIVRVDDDFYLAKVESLKQGRTMAFEEDAVQKRMLETLRGEQFTRMRRDMEATLRRESVVEKKAPMLMTTVEMAMQNYARWHD